MDLKEGDLVWFRQYDDMLGEGPGIDQLGIYLGPKVGDPVWIRVIGERSGFLKNTGIRTGMEIIDVYHDDVWPSEVERAE